MNEQNPAPASSQTTSSPDLASSHPAPTANSRGARVSQTDCPNAFNTPPTATPPLAPVVDDALEEDDIHVAINVSITTRHGTLAKFPMNRTFYGAAKSQSLFKELDNLLEALYQGAALKVNRRLRPKEDEPAEAEAPKSKTNGRRVPSKEPIARSPKDEEFDQVFADLDRRLRPGDSRVRSVLKSTAIR